MYRQKPSSAFTAKAFIHEKYKSDLLFLTKRLSYLRKCSRAADGMVITDDCIAVLNVVNIYLWFTVRGLLSVSNKFLSWLCPAVSESSGVRRQSLKVIHGVLEGRLRLPARGARRIRHIHRGTRRDCSVWITINAIESISLFECFNFLKLQIVWRRVRQNGERLLYLEDNSVQVGQRYFLPLLQSYFSMERV